MAKPKVTKTKTDEQLAVSGSAGFLGASKQKKVIRAWKQGSNVQHWWLEDPKKLHNAVDAVVARIEESQVTRRMLGIKFSRMYGNYDAIGFPYSNLMKSSPDSSTNNKVTLNIIQNIIDTAGAKIAKDKPKISFVTTGADDYFLKLRAVNLTKYISGLFKEAQVYENSQLVFRDACVVGTGHLKVFEEDGKIKTEWCFYDEIRIDELDGIKQKPRSMHQIRLVSRDQLFIKYPEFSDKIMGAQSALMGRVANMSTTDMVRVTESWHLPTTDTSGDGLHCLTIAECTLMSEEYKKNYFPIIPFRWYPRPLGYFGRSITEEIMTIQVEINKILRTIQQSQELIAVPLIFVESSSKVSEDVLLSNTVARMVPYSGTPPAIVSPQALSPEVYNHLNSFIQWAYQIVGISEASGSGMKPAGVDSAVAIREVADIESGRFAQVASSWEDWFIEVARVMVDLSRDLYKDNKDLSVTYSEKKILKEIKWKDVDLEENPFDIQSFPVSQLPDTPAGRIQTITEYIQNQWISKERGMELLNLDPDLEQEVNIQTASLRLTEKWLSEMVEDGTIHKPEPFMNLALAQQVSQGIYNMLVHDGCPEERLSLVREFIMECIDMQKPPPAPGPVPGVTPPPEQQVPAEGTAVPGTQPPAPAQPPLAPQPAPLSQT